MNDWEKARDCFIGLGAIIAFIFFLGWLSGL
jgi:flagellar biogenesis protein FliO